MTVTVPPRDLVKRERCKTVSCSNSNERWIHRPTSYVRARQGCATLSNKNTGCTSQQLHMRDAKWTVLTLAKRLT